MGAAYLKSAAFEPFAPLSDAIAGCTGKVAFLSAAAALAVRDRDDRGQRARKHWGTAHAYHCRHCGAFHLGRPHANAMRKR